MPKHSLKPTWTKIASKGENADVVNTGKTVIEIAKSANARKGILVVVDSRFYGSGLLTDLYARSSEPGGEVTTTVTPGSLPEL